MIKKTDCFAVSFAVSMLLLMATIIFYSSNEKAFFICLVLLLVSLYISFVLAKFAWKETKHNVSYKYYLESDKSKTKYTNKSGLIFSNDSYDGTSDLIIKIPYVIFENINFNNVKINLPTRKKANRTTKALKFINCTGTINLEIASLDSLTIENDSKDSLKIKVCPPYCDYKYNCIIGALILTKKSNVSISVTSNHLLGYYFVSLSEQSNLFLNCIHKDISTIEEFNNSIYFLLMQDKSKLHVEKGNIHLGCNTIYCLDNSKIYSHGYEYNLGSEDEKDKIDADTNIFLLIKNDIINDCFMTSSYTKKDLTFIESCEFYRDFYQKNYFWRVWEDEPYLNYHGYNLCLGNIVSHNVFDLGLTKSVDYAKEDKLVSHCSSSAHESIATKYDEYESCRSDRIREASYMAEWERLNSDINLYMHNYDIMDKDEYLELMMRRDLLRQKIDMQPENVEQADFDSLELFIYTTK